MKKTICCHSAITPGKASVTARTSMATAATLGAAAKNAVAGVGAPSYTSGVHMWNGTADILKAIPARKKTRPKITPTETSPCSTSPRPA